MRTFVSIIIPLKEINGFLLKETLPAILKQSDQDFEIILLPDRKTNQRLKKTKIIATWPKVGPADKRDIGARQAKGEILAFLDDDSYPDKNWLKNAVRIFEQDAKIAGVCGPSLTPPQNNLYQKASGYVWSTWLGSGGAGTYRCAAGKRREVDDFPTVNLLVRKKDFLVVGGFDSRFWPGEDTKLCHDLVYQLGKKIIYSPRVLVYHHRREIFVPHLRQISRYALHRGHFARVLPKTSLRPGYFFPSLFALGLIFGLPFVYILYHFNFADLGILFWRAWLAVLIFYLVLLLVTAFQVFFKEKNLRLSFLVIPSILATHLIYGALFIKGFLTPKLKSKYKK